MLMRIREKIRDATRNYIMDPVDYVTKCAIHRQINKSVMDLLFNKEQFGTLTVDLPMNKSGVVKLTFEITIKD